MATGTHLPLPQNTTVISRSRNTTPTPFILPHNKRPTVFIYPTGKIIPSPPTNPQINIYYPVSVSPESIVIPIVSCILGFPLLALLVICCLRKRAKMARDRARRRNYDLEQGTLSLIGISPLHPSKLVLQPFAIIHYI